MPPKAVKDAKSSFVDQQRVITGETAAEDAVSMFWTQFQFAIACIEDNQQNHGYQGKESTQHTKYDHTNRSFSQSYSI